uniref:type II secretion system F family protein n=1 Tax=Acetatifactor sp. TaxID=1872090 RepID=UPI0040576FC1
MKTNLKRRDYRKYVWTGREFVWAVMQACMIVAGMSYFFYRSLWACIPLSTIGWLYFRLLARKKRDSCKEELILQFKECILSVAASLKAGYAVENAFLECRDDMELLYGKESLIYQELEGIRRGLVINITLEEQLYDMAERSGSEEIGQFATVFSIAKRNGGNLPEIIGTTADLISRKLEARQEMQTMLSGRRMEQTVMKLVPFGVVGYIGISYPGYFDILYHNFLGAAVMTGCLILYLLAYIFGEKVLEKIALEMA